MVILLSPLCILLMNHRAHEYVPEILGSSVAVGDALTLLKHPLVTQLCQEHNTEDCIYYLIAQ